MATTLLTTGLLCVIAAIVGGGIEALGGKVPVIQSTKRQTVLGLFGMILLLGAWFSSSGSSKLRAVPRAELAKLDLKSMTFNANGRDGLALRLYNGTVWTLKDITVHVRLVDQLSQATVFDSDVSFPLDTTPDSEHSGEPFKESDFLRNDAIANIVRPNNGAFVVEKKIVGATGTKTD
jgi:hypothetical protein